MELKAAIEHALDGNAILFVGSGFSVGAMNVRGQPFKIGTELAKYLCKLADSNLTEDLDEAAESFLEKESEDQLIDVLQHEFAVKQIKDYHKQVGAIPWKIVYTTNYDNVLEKAFTENQKRLQPITLSDNITWAARGKFTYCVHLNGFIDRLNRGTLKNEFKLTNTSYVTTSVANSPWASKFRDDIVTARAIFFLGYSLNADLDIGRILAANSLQDKGLFIIGPQPTESTLRRAKSFGTAYSISTEEFAAEVSKIKAAYLPRKEGYLGRVIHQVEIPKLTRNFSDKKVFDLLLYGKTDPEFIFMSYHGGPPYFLHRNIAVEIMDTLDHDDQIAVITSNLGNGKSMLLDGIKYRALEQEYDVFDVGENLGDVAIQELDLILRKFKKPLLIIDNYRERLNLVDYYAKNATANSRIILASRSSIHEALSDDIYKDFPGKRLVEFNLDKLEPVEIEWVNSLFNQYGLWGSEASEVQANKIERLKRLGEFNRILLEVLKSPQILERFKVILETLEKQLEYYDIILSILILTVLNYQPSINKLVDFWGERILDPHFRMDRAAQELISFGADEMKMRSSTSAAFLLRKNIIPNKLIINVISHMAAIANDRAKLTPYYDLMFKNLMKFSNIQSLLPESARLTSIVTYYENIKNLSGARDNPLFWLQYAIACLKHRDFVRAAKYFETAYSFTVNRDFNTFQIDNHYANYLLTRSIYQPHWRPPADVFFEAHDIISAQMMRETSYPYRVAKFYGKFYDVNYAKLDPETRAEILSIARSIYLKISQLPRHDQNHRSVRECKEAMLLIMNYKERKSDS